ncbi:MAG: hypothetical protein H7Y09_07760, partial [Chitinophagaceae bacterium]|nr:hypothetical protein [Anaerolineae bacterium]
MRYALILMLLSSLFLAACGGGDDSTPVPEAATTAPQPTPETTSEVSDTTQQALGEVTEVPTAFLPAPGVLAAAPVTEEPTPEDGSPLQPTSGFDTVILAQTGGPNNITLLIEVYSDGRVVTNGTESTASADQIAALGQLIDDISFFNVQGTFLGAPGRDDIYRYQISVTRGDLARSIQAQEGFLPP